MTALQIIQTQRIEESLAQDANIGTSRETLDHGGMISVRLAHRTVGAVTSAPNVAHEKRTINMNLLTEIRARQ